MPDLTSKTTTELVADSGNGVQDWAARHADHTLAGHGDWGQIDSSDTAPPPPPPPAPDPEA